MNNQVMESKTENKTEKKSKRISKFKKIYGTVLGVIMTAMISGMNVFAGDGDATSGGTLDGLTSGNAATKMLTFVWWAIIAVCGIFGGAGIIKFIQAQAEEDPRGRNNGIATVLICGVAIVGVFAIKNLTT